MRFPAIYRAGRSNERAGPEWRPIPALWWALTAGAALTITAAVVTVWLWAVASQANSGTDRASARLDAVRTGLAAGAGAAAAVGLTLAFRRQYHQEIATLLTDRDATERRITELYTRATEQLGSDKAPVRLGGLYALERLAQDNPAHRQTIVNVLCAYLRMPFPASRPESPPKRRRVSADLGQQTPEALDAPSTGILANGGANLWEQEKEVRVTAQRILATHLRNVRAADNSSECAGTNF